MTQNKGVVGVNRISTEFANDACQDQRSHAYPVDAHRY